MMSKARSKSESGRYRVFHKPTVFILGAGASAPYDYPQSQRLIDEILSLGKPESDQLGISLGPFQEFQRDLRNSHQPSIDAFLEHRQEFLKAGKLAIAHRITRYENEELLKMRDWYSRLVNRMAQRFEDVSKNQLSVITFNYDRSLEHFLFESIKARFGKTEGEVAEALSSISIHHVYGRLGRLPWQSKVNSESCRARQYGDQSARATIESAEGIRLIHERNEHDTLQSVLDERLKNAEWIFILGFGYQQENMGWIRGASGRPAGIRATCLGLTDARKSVVSSRHKIAFMHNSNSTADDFLADEAGFLDDAL
jgi:hypothetical protein